jgi:hypothetical protein
MSESPTPAGQKDHLHARRCLADDLYYCVKPGIVGIDQRIN